MRRGVGGVIVVEGLKSLFAAAGFMALASGLGPEKFAQYISIASIMAVLLPIVTVGLNWWIQPLAQISGVVAAASVFAPVFILSSLASLFAIVFIALITGWPFTTLISVALVEIVVYPLWSFLALVWLTVGKMRKYFLYALLPPLLKLLSSVLFVFLFGMSLEWWGIFASLLGAVGLVLFLMNMRPDGIVSGYSHLIDWGRRGLSFASIGSISALTENIDRLITPSMLNPADVGSYGVASKLSGYGALPLRSIATMTYPKYFAEALVDQKNVRKLMYKTILRSLPYAVVSMFLLAGGTFLLAPVFLESYNGISQVVYILTLLIPARSIQYASGDVLYAIGRPMRRLVVTVVGAAITGVSVLVGANFGLIGAATGLVVAVVVSSLFSLTMAELELGRHGRKTE